jgi:hypothetical protein
LGACSTGTESQPGDPPELGTGAQAIVTPDGCKVGDESLGVFAEKCKAAMGCIEVPAFNCDDGVEVPDTQGDGLVYPNETCDRPNVLSGRCDPGSRFQVLVNKKNAAGQQVVIVAHCRRKGGAVGTYKDTAVIAHNQVSGDTCFFQDADPASVDPKLPGAGVPAPINDTIGFWGTPAATAGLMCVGCHDNGPFVRTPYLTQLKGTTKTEALPPLPEDPLITTAQQQASTKAIPAILPGSRDNSGNSTQPYRFVGANFQGWKAYAVSQTGSRFAGFTQNRCVTCHRMGLSSNEASGARVWNTGVGTTLDFGKKATAELNNGGQAHKNPHVGTAGALKTSPIWMLRAQNSYDQTVYDEQNDLLKCGAAIAETTTLPQGCGYTQFAQGNTCVTPATTVIVNGATVGPVTITPVETVVTVPLGPDIAFAGWTSMHGPFRNYAQSAYGTAGFNGTFAQIRVENTPPQYVIRSGGSGKGGGSPSAEPGGEVGFVRYLDIAGITANQGTYASYALNDVLGTQTSVSTTVDLNHSACLIHRQCGDGQSD